MAIWPFGRKNKRHTIQVSADEATTLQSSLEQDPPVAEPTLGRKPSRRPSKLQPNRPFRTGDGSDSGRASSLRPLSSLDQRASQLVPERLGQEDAPQRPLSRTESLLRKQAQSRNGPNKLRKSKRQTDEVLREREIRVLSSTPIDIPRRATPLGSDYMLEQRRRGPNGRRADRYMSDISVSIRDSAASSMSDTSDPYTYKVNAFAALTPRPAVRYVEQPRGSSARSHEPSMGKEPSRRDKDKLQALTTSEENLYYSRRRVNELADSLDAGALRELLERDRRRREKQQMEDKERLQRKLQDKADAQQREGSQQPAGGSAEAQRVRDDNIQDKEGKAQTQDGRSTAPALQPESWLRGESKDGEAAGRDSLESVNANVIGNIDESSLRESKLAPGASFAPSHEMGMSRTTLSPSHSSLRQGLSSPSRSQTFGVGSTSDLSERQSSDASGRRGNTISSLFRRGSSRLKRHYRERFQDTPSEISHASHPSHDSFFRVQTSSSPPQTGHLPSRSFGATGNMKRPRSRFTEHFSEEPLSPPDSRLQSPDIPEQVVGSAPESTGTRTFLHGPTPSASMDIANPRRRGHHSWTESFDAESDNVPLSQSLASIDSEGSWMSGQIFRRMSQKPSSPVRTNISSFSAALDGAADPHDEACGSIDPRGLNSAAVGETESEADETWHHIEVARRPVVVTPTVRPRSTQGALKSIPSLSPISAEEDYISAEEENPIPSDLASVHGEIGHAEQD